MTKTDVQFAKPKGRIPTLQFMAPDELSIDPAYQRSIDGEDSQRLIRAIAKDWDWDLCLPLVVSRREDGGHYVLDGQHRLEAARRRGDIPHLPCVIGSFAGAAGEAATFVSLNQKRRPLCKVDIFKAAVAAGDEEAVEILAMIEAAVLMVAPHLTAVGWKPGMIGNIGGIEQAKRRFGAHVAGEALQCLAAAFAGTVLQYAGTIYPGLVAVCATECADGKPFPPHKFSQFTSLLGKLGQQSLRQKIAFKATEPGFSRSDAAIFVLRNVWQHGTLDAPAKPALVPPAARPRPSPAAMPGSAGTMDRYDLREKAKAEWCSQCEKLCTAQQAADCESRWCSLRDAA